MILKLESILNEAFKSLGLENNSKVSKSEIENVDFQCNDAFKLAKVYKKNPLEICESVCDYLNNLSCFDEYFSMVSFAKPGFINIKVSDNFINNSLMDIINDERFGMKKSSLKIVLDYGGPNVAKPLHVGHLRTAIIGQAINNILKFQGNETISDVHLGDIGLQMGQVLYGILRDFKGIPLEDISFDLNYLNKTYPEISALCKENEEVKEECALITKELQEGNLEYKALWKKIYDISVSDIKRLYDYLSVSFYYWYGESDAYKYFPKMMDLLKGIMVREQGALVVPVALETDKVTMPPCIIQKSNGAYLYSTSDLGTIYQRVLDFNPDEIIYVADARQSLHFTQIFRVAKKSEMFLGNLEFVGYGTVNGPDNKPFKTRSGASFKLDDLISEVKNTFISMREENSNMDNSDLDKIVNSIIKFADLQNDLERNYIFDISKFSEVNGKTGPYILYTYLRFNKIIDETSGELSLNIYNEADRKLRMKLLEVSSVLDSAALEKRPHYIANYLYELATVCNNFYGVNKINGLTGQIKCDYNIILKFNNKVIKTLLNLLGIDVPKVM